MGFLVDFSQLEKFVKDMKITERDFNGFLEDFLYRMALEVLRETRPKTPVDTGALKNAWALGSITSSGRDRIAETAAYHIRTAC